MKALFLDTSALIKFYLEEQGTTWIKIQCHPDAGYTIVISQATLVEAIATLCRRVREQNPAQRITKEERDRLITLFRQDARDQYQIVKVTTSLYKKAGNLCRIHPLRAYDAVQLISALTMRSRLINSGQPAPIFVSADDKLLEQKGSRWKTPTNINSILHLFLLRK